MGLFPQFPYSNLHELNLDWIIEQIRQVTGEGVVLSVNGLSGVVTLYTENNIALPDCHYDTEWSVARLIDEKIAGIKFTGEKFFYITKNHDAEEFTVQEVYTSGNPPPYPVTSVNGHDGTVVLAGDNLPYVIDGPYTIEDIVEAIERAIGAVIHGKQCRQAVTAGQYVFLIMSNISGREDGLYKAVNNVSANTDWTSADLQAVSGGLGAEVSLLDNKVDRLQKAKDIGEFASLSALQNGLQTQIASMSELDTLFFKCFLNPGQDPFVSTHYVLMITKFLTESGYDRAHIYAYRPGSGTGDIVGYYINGSWTWDTYALNSKISGKIPNSYKITKTSGSEGYIDLSITGKTVTPENFVKAVPVDNTSGYGLIPWTQNGVVYANIVNRSLSPQPNMQINAYVTILE